MNMVLFYITKSKELVIAFLITMFVLGFTAFCLLKSFKQNQKWKIIFYGLFLQMTNLDILKLSILIVKTFMIFYAICVSDRTKIYMSLIIIAILSIIYILIYVKRLIHELICTIIELAGIYFIFLTNEYISTISESMLLMVVLGFSIGALIFFSIYLFFKELDVISNSRTQKIIKGQNERISNE